MVPMSCLPFILWSFILLKGFCSRKFQNPILLSFRGLLRARSRFPEIVGIIRKQEQRKESLEPGLVLAKQVLSQLSYTPTSSELLTFYDTYAATSCSFPCSDFGTFGTNETS